MSEWERFSVMPVVREHYRGLISPGRRRPSWGTWLGVIGLPILIGAAALYFQMRLPAAALTPLLTGTGLLVGAFVTAFVLLINLRIKVSETENWKYRATLVKLIGTTSASCLYAASVAFLVVALLVVGASIPLLREDPFHLIGTAGLFAVTAHLAATFTTVVRRLFGVYVSMFAADFDPELRIVGDGRPGDKRRSA